MKENKLAIVTGASRGLGRDVAESLSRQGYFVIGTYLKNSDLALELLNTGVQEMINLDVRDREEVESFYDKIFDKYQEINILINNAGIHRDSIAKKMDISIWKEVIDVNLTGTFNMISCAIPFMELSGYGRIVNIGSIVGLRGGIGLVNYASSKSGLIGLTKSVAREVAKKNITVNLVSVGYIEKGMGARLPSNIKEEVLKTIPIGKFGESEDVINLVSFLISEASNYLTGQVIGVDGGLSM